MPKKIAPTPLTKALWVNEFVKALVIDLRPELGPRFAKRIAVNEWPQAQTMDPIKAAMTWPRRGAAR